MIDKDEQYVVVTTVHTFRHRYAVPMSELQACNTDMPASAEWALDAVTMNEVEEFSQKGLGEHIVDAQVMDQEQILQLFDGDNDYLKSWSKEQKLQTIHRCWFNEKGGRSYSKANPEINMSDDV